MLSKKLLPVMRYGIEKFKICFSIFSETMKSIVMKFSVTIDVSIGVAEKGLSISAINLVVTGSEKRNRNFQS
jgi:hypothetical protein